ncbi:MAG: SCP2 sterol-binding domain-containing protein [Candidatus Thorarchaeota archaeon]
MTTEEELLEVILNMVKKAEEPKMLKRFTNYTKTLLMSFEDLGIDLTVSFVDGKGTVEKGTAPDPNMTVRTDTRTIIDILGGNLSAMRAFMTGKIKADGPARDLMKLQHLLKA